MMPVKRSKRPLPRGIFEFLAELDQRHNATRGHAWRLSLPGEVGTYDDVRFERDELCRQGFTGSESHLRGSIGKVFGFDLGQDEVWFLAPQNDNGKWTYMQRRQWDTKALIKLKRKLATVVRQPEDPRQPVKEEAELFKAAEIMGYDPFTDSLSANLDGLQNEQQGYFFEIVAHLRKYFFLADQVKKQGHSKLGHPAIRGLVLSIVDMVRKWLERIYDIGCRASASDAFGNPSNGKAFDDAAQELNRLKEAVTSKFQGDGHDPIRDPLLQLADDVLSSSRQDFPSKYNKKQKYIARHIQKIVLNNLPGRPAWPTVRDHLTKWKAGNRFRGRGNLNFTRRQFPTLHTPRNRSDQHALHNLEIAARR